MQWLRFERKCMIVIRERSPRWQIGSPDVLGITRCRYLTEIEIKRSVSDFRADANKRHRINRDHYIRSAPKHTYYMVHQDLVEKVKPILPSWAGLLDARKTGKVFVAVPAPTNDQHQKLSVKECIRLAHLMANHIISAETSVEATRSQWRCGHEPYWQSDYEI